MTGFFEDQGLRFMGLDDQDIADLNKALPEMDNILALGEKLWPTIVADIPLISAELPKAAPHISNLMRIARKVIAKQRTLT